MSGGLLPRAAADGHYFVSADKGEKMARSFLSEETGETLADWPEAGTGAKDRLDCAKVSCVLHGARPHGRDHHQRGRVTAQMRQRRRDRQSGAGRVSLPIDEAGHRPYRLVAA